VKIDWSSGYGSTFSSSQLTNCQDRVQRPSRFFKKFYFHQAEWAEVYDFVEFIALVNGDPHRTGSRFTKDCNYILERELSGYRFSGVLLVPITDEQELAAIQKALEFPDPLKPARLHVKTAVELLSDRKSPDYRNSIKESIRQWRRCARFLPAMTTPPWGRASRS
jgi:hypothetical protein